MTTVTAERDKEYFEGKLSANAVAVDDLNQKMNTLSLKLESAEETMKNREHLELFSHPFFLS